jgi:hypothetical protein
LNLLALDTPKNHRTQTAIADRQRLGLPVLRRFVIPKHGFSGIGYGKHGKS